MAHGTCFHVLSENAVLRSPEWHTVIIVYEEAPEGRFMPHVYLLAVADPQHDVISNIFFSCFSP